MLNTFNNINMKTKKRAFLKAVILVNVALCIFVSLAHAESYENYLSGNILRKYDVGNIYEYYDEDRFPSDPWKNYGRLILAYEGAGYKTWNWDLLSVENQVLVEEYVGSYNPAPNSPPLSDLQITERRVRYIYDHHGAMMNLDTRTNGWIEREKTIYGTDGTSVLEKYLRDSSSRLTKDIHTDINTYFTYEYHTGPGMENSVHYKNEYNYNEANEAAVIDGTASGNFIASYEYIDADYMVKRDVAGRITTLLLTPDGKSYNNTYIDPADNVLHVYNWDSFWNLKNVKKYYSSGRVETYTPRDPTDPVWPLQDVVVPSTDFIKGVNLPWVNYGYGLGLSRDTGEHYGFSRNLASLYEKMDKRKGDFVRLFTFADLRAGMIFAADGTPIGFTDKVYDDMRALLDAAKALGIPLMPVLFDYMFADGAGPSDYADLINDATKRQALLNIFSDFFATFADDPSISAWDIMNEPEYASLATISNLKTFVKDFAALIHSKAPAAKVTVGARNRSDLVNWTGLGLDLYQFHYYDVIEPTLPLDYLASLLGLDKPVMAGELQPTDVVNKLTTLKQNGYAGGLFWEDGDYAISDADYAFIQEWNNGTVFT